MTYVKAVLVGLVSALAFAVLWIIVGLVLPALWSLQSTQGGIGAVSIGIGEFSVLLAALIGFGVGFFWMLRRASRSMPRTS